MYKLLIIFTVTHLFSQNQMNNWYMGGAGYNFSTASEITTSAMNSFEATGSISDNSGNLLFYTDGATIWNKNNLVMLNGSGLWGEASSTQLGIVKQPNSPNLYIVFTLPAQADTMGNVSNGFCHGCLSYSVVDMNLDGGLGGVVPTQKNISLYNRTSEKIAFLRHSNGCDIWAITHGYPNNTFYAHKITQNGVNPNPVITNIGISHYKEQGTSCSGEMKIAPNGTKLACAIEAQHAIQIFDIDNNSGVLSNPITLTDSFNLNLPNYFRNGQTYQSYGICFSPNSNLLYSSLVTFPYKIFQYNLSAGTESQIFNSKVLIDSSNTDNRGISIGPDNKLYVSHWATSIGRISNPDNIGISCNYVSNAINLSKSTSTTLPNYINDFNECCILPCPGSNRTITVCENDSVNLLTVGGIVPNFDGALSGPGILFLDTITQFQTQVMYFNNAQTQYSGTYIYSYSIRQGGCIYSDTITLMVNQKPNVQINSNSPICEGDTLQLSHQVTANNYLWITPQNDSIRTNSFQILNAQQNQSGIYTLIINNGTCSDSANIFIVINPKPNFQILSDTFYCQGDTLKLSVQPIFNMISWDGPSNFNTTSSNVVIKNINTIQSGVYRAKVQIGNCSTTDSIAITVNNKPIASINSNSPLCEGDTLKLASINTAQKYQWKGPNNLNVANSSVLIEDVSITNQGTYQLTLSNINCMATVETTVVVKEEVTINPNNIFSPNNDNINDTWEINNLPNNKKTEIYNRWGNIIYQSNTIPFKWNGKDLNNNDVSEGVYYYTITYDGCKKMITKKGSVSLFK